MKRLAEILGIVFGVLGWLAINGESPTHDGDVKLREFALVAFFLCFLLIWYGSRKRSANNPPGNS
jgi:hypothetical protein